MEIKQNGADTLSCMSFNLWGGKDWEARREAVLWEIRRMMPDTLGIQEGKVQWLKVFEEELFGEYGCAGKGNREAGYTETFDNIYYRRDRFELLREDTVWLSGDLHAEGSKFAESKRVRIAVFAFLRDRVSGRELLAANTHLDNLGETPRNKQVRVLLDYIEGTGLPCVLTGDFNSRMTTDVYRTVTEVMDDSRTAAVRREAGETYNGAGEHPEATLDYCFFTKGQFELPYYRTQTDRYLDSVYPSDHNAVYAEYRFRT